MQPNVAVGASAIARHASSTVTCKGGDCKNVLSSRLLEVYGNINLPRYRFLISWLVRFWLYTILFFVVPFFFTIKAGVIM